jgi:hypothetical protein
MKVAKLLYGAFAGVRMVYPCSKIRARRSAEGKIGGATNLVTLGLRGCNGPKT